MAEYSNQVESRTPADALEVEQLDNNLYRSKRLWLPRRSRGVFGGQVISQALVSASHCVDEVYSLHVSTPSQEQSGEAEIQRNQLPVYRAQVNSGAYPSVDRHRKFGTD